MKRHIALLLALSLVLLVACAGQSASSSQETETQELIEVGVSQTGAESDWRVASSESIKSVFTEENGYQLLFDIAKQKQENQIMAVRKFIQQQVDYIVLMPISETGWDSVLQEAQEAGIPVIIADRAVDVEDDSLYTAHVGSDFRLEGEHAVKWIEEHYGNEPVNIVHVQGTIGSTAQLGRSAALEDAAEEHESWTILTQLDGDFTQPKAYEALCDYFSAADSLPEIQVVYCENDSEAFGAIKALREYGYTVGGENGVSILSFDATRSGLMSCMAGDIALDVECNPDLGELIENIIQQLERGETPEKNSYVRESFFTSAQLTQTLIDKRSY